VVPDLSNKISGKLKIVYMRRYCSLLW